MASTINPNTIQAQAGNSDLVYDIRRALIAAKTDIEAVQGGLGIAFVQAGTGAISRTTSDKLGESLSVKDFGATSDGVADDTDAIQAAADAVPVGGGELIVPPGTYRITSTIYLKAGTRLRAFGATIKASADWVSAPNAMIRNVNWSAAAITDTDIIIDGLTFDFGDFGAVDPAGGGQHCLSLRKVRGVRVRNCTFQCRTAENATAFQSCDDTLIEGCSAYDFLNCGWDHWDQPRNARVIGCYAESADTAQMANFNPEESTTAASAGYVADGFVLANNVFVSTNATAAEPIQIEPLVAGTSVRNVTVTGNLFRNTFLAMRGDTANLTISGNVFEDVLGGSSPISIHPLYDGTPANAVVTGNTIINPTTVSGNLGVIRIGATNAVVVGNSVTGTTYGTVAGIYTGTTLGAVGVNYVSNGVVSTPSMTTGTNPISTTGVTAGTVAVDTVFTIGGAATITTGTGIPVAGRPRGSLWFRSDGAVGSTLYVSQGAGTWNPVAGV